MSDQKHCFELSVFNNNPCDIIIKYCEVLVRILANLFYSVSDDFKYDYSTDIFTKKFGKKKEFFLDQCSHFIQEFFKGMTRVIQSHQFEIMSLTFKPDIDYLTRYIRIVNDKYIEHCEKKFGCIEEK